MSTNTEMAERNQNIYRQRLAGNTYVSIAKLFGISSARTREICIREARIERMKAKLKTEDSVP